MSRIGKKPVAVPEGVKVSVADGVVAVEGKLGKLQYQHCPEVAVTVDQNAKMVNVARKDDGRRSRAIHGLTRALIQNMVVGVTQGYEKRLEIVGVGYVATVQHNRLEIRAGYANELHKPIPPGLQVSCPDQQHVLIRGIDKQQVGEFAAEVRSLREPEPYKGKGIRYQEEQVRRKQGKAMVK